MILEATRPFGWRYVFRLALGVLFLWAALGKLGDLSAFADQVHNFRMIPVPLENLFALTLPWVELVAALLLVTNLAPRAATLTLGILLVVFLIAILSAIARNLDIECGCFGTHDAARTGWVTLGRDVGMLLLAVFGYPRRRGAHRLQEKEAVPA
jgi:uncharacterized membrane protein YphA (DoxX/SURF4 family)